MMFQLVFLPIRDDHKSAKSNKIYWTGIYNSFLPQYLLEFNTYKQFIMQNRINDFELCVYESLDEMYDSTDNDTPPLGNEYINDNDFIYWVSSDENFVTDKLSHYLARAIANIADVMDCSLLIHATANKEVVNDYIMQKKTFNFVTCKANSSSMFRSRYSEPVVDKVYFECAPSDFEFVFKNTTGFLEHITGFVIERGKFEELKKLIIADTKSSEWMANIINLAAMHFECIRHNIGLRILSNKINLQQFIEQGKLKMINDEMKTIEYKPSE
ncbi:MAG TPA: hypothetical protein PK745_15160 [bacterium]|nr:hypothetical protein [bacterium]